MEISFKRYGNIQLIQIVGPISEMEAAAIRFKLDEKINTGRRKILFDLGRFDLNDEASRKYLLSLIVYTINRDTLTVCCDVPAEQWPGFLVPGDRQIKMMATVNEGLTFLKANEPPSLEEIKAALAKKKSPDAEIKDRALKQLLEKYDVYQHSNEDDPHRLQFIAQQYRTTPSTEALGVERKAIEHFVQLQDEIKIMDSECEKLSGRVKALMRYRKTPLSPKELKVKEDSLIKEMDQLKSDIRGLENEIQRTRGEIAEAVEADREFTGSVDKELRELEAKVVATEQNFIKEQETLALQDAKEESEFQTKINAIR